MFKVYIKLIICIILAFFSLIYVIKENIIVLNYDSDFKELKADYSMLYSKIAELESKIESMESLE